LRSSVADYEVISALSGPDTKPRYLCRRPDRLESDGDQVMVTELGVDAAGRQTINDYLIRFAAVDSDRLLAVIEVGPDPDTADAGVYLATETAPGGWLSSVSETMPISDRVRAVADAARGAHALHEAGLAHGAINSKAIVLSERGGLLSPPPLDLPPGALTRMLDWRDVITLDPNLLGGEESSRSSDIWALGATLHVVLSERSLYPGIETDPPVTAVQRILFSRPEVDPELAPEVAVLIRSCLEPDPAARPTTAEEVADRLQETVPVP
jgi:eukaryotic-like serine/threonine-protein kinase